MANPERTRPATVWLWLGAVFLFLLGVFAVRFLTRDQALVRISPVTYQTLSSTVATNGKVEPVEPFQAHAVSAGVIQKLLVQVGQHVSPGTLLVRMDSSDATARIASGKASLSGAEVSLQNIAQGGSSEERNRFTTDIGAAKTEQEQAAKNLVTVQTLQAKGAASAGEVVAAQQRLNTADVLLRNSSERTKGRYSAADRNSAQTRIAEAKASIAAAQAAYAGANIRSPIAGMVYSIPVSEYDFVPAGEDLLDIADLNRIQVRAYFDEPEIGKLMRGQAVKIVWDAKPGSTWHGHIERAPTTVVTYGTRNVGECIITVDDAKGDLLPNTNVTVTVTESQRFNVLSVPREALHTDGASNYVYRIVSGKLAQTPVQVGVVNLTSVEITGGLTGNDVVVLSSVTSGRELVNGLSVKRVE